jgi:CheY-like chemotaxis protein
VIGDDVDELRELLCFAVEAEGDMVVVGQAADGREVLQLVEDEHPDVLLLDLSMPGMDGFEVLQALRTNGEDVGVVILSAHTSAAMSGRALEQGADRYIEKGTRGAAIRQVLRDVAREHQPV